MIEKILTEITKSRLLFTFKEIPLYISGSLIIFLSALSVSMGIAGGWVAVAALLFVMTTVYAIVTLHEYGHALTAGHYGYPCDNITLFPFMGAASIPLSYDNPKAEFWITLNGPLVNFVLALVTLPILWAFPEYFALQFFFETNVLLLAFNMVPAYPMDGGRLFRSLLGLNVVTPWKAARISYYTTLAILPFFVLFVYWYFSIVAAVLVCFMGGMCYVEFQMTKEQHQDRQKVETRIKDLIAAGSNGLIININETPFDIPSVYDEAVASYVYYEELIGVLDRQGKKYRLPDDLASVIKLTCDLKNLDPQEKEWFRDSFGKPASLQRCISKKILKSRLTDAFI